MNWLLLINSLTVASLATAGALVSGGVVALFVAGLRKPWQWAFLCSGLIALALPPFVLTNTWLHLLGSTGAWRPWLPLNLFSVPGAAFLLTLTLWPIPMLAIWSAWTRIEPPHLETDPQIAGRHLLPIVLLPLARPVIAPALVLTFALAIGNFAIPALLQVKVFPAEMWIRFNTSFDTAGALILSLPMVCVPLVLLWVLHRKPVPWPHLQTAVGPDEFRNRLGQGPHALCGLLTLVLVTLSVALPLGQLVSASGTWRELQPAAAAGGGAIMNSVLAASATATLVSLLSIVAIPPLPGSTQWPRWFGRAAWLFFLVPGVLLGISLILLLNRPWLAPLYQGFGIVILAFGLRYLAFAWNTTLHASSAVDRSLIEMAETCGATCWQKRLLAWPQIRAHCAVAWYSVYLLCLWDVESILLIVPPGGETLAVRIFNLLHYGHNPQVNALCLILICLAVAPLIIAAVCALVTPLFRFRAAAPALIALASALFSGCGSSAPSDQFSVSSAQFSAVKIVASRGVGVGQVNKPRSVTVDLSDSLFVVDITGRVQKFLPGGAFELQWQMPETDIGRPKGLCRDLQGNIVVNEPHYARMNHFTPAGKLVFQWGKHGRAPGQLGFPRSVAVNAYGEIYVAEYSSSERIQRFRIADSATNGTASRLDVTPGIEFLNEWGRMGSNPGEFNRPEGICVDSANLVYVADSCNHRVQVFSREGVFLRAFGSAGQGKGQLSYPYDLCVDSTGLLYVCEFGNSRIQVFTTQGEPLEVIGGPGRLPGQFNNPWGVALDSKGNLYVADSQNHRVQKLLRRDRLGQSGGGTS